MSGDRMARRKTRPMGHRLLPWLLLGALLLAGARPLAAQPNDPIETQLAQMTPQERVGQDTGPESDIGRLITEYKIGGVVLLASNSNFFNAAPDTPH